MSVKKKKPRCKVRKSEPEKEKQPTLLEKLVEAKRAAGEYSECVGRAVDMIEHAIDETVPEQVTSTLQDALEELESVEGLETRIANTGVFVVELGGAIRTGVDLTISAIRGKKES